MAGEAIVLQAAENAIEQGLGNLPPQKKAAILGCAFSLLGVTLCFLAVTQFMNALKKPQQPAQP